MSPLVDLRSTYLYADGPDLVRVEAASLWRRLIDGTPTSPEAERVAHGAGWLVGVFVYEASWPSWEMHPEADEVVCVHTPRELFAIGQFYEDFTQTTDDQVREALRELAIGPMAP